MLFLAPVWAQQPADGFSQELLRQQERERALRQQQATTPDVRFEHPLTVASAALPANEQPCFPIHRIALTGEAAEQFQWALQAANPPSDPATGRCLGIAGINLTMKRIQNAIIARGFVTTRILAAPQDLSGGLLTLTVVPGRIRTIQFAPEADPGGTAWNAVPARPGDLLNLRAIEQALENFKRVPTAEADIRILPAAAADAGPGESDLAIVWRQRPPIRMSFTLDDAGSEGSGKTQAGATLSLDNLGPWNDLFYLNLGRGVLNGGGKGTDSWAAHYSVPLGYWLLGATISSYDYYRAVAGDSQTYIYSGSSQNAELQLKRLLYRDAVRKAGAGLRGWSRQSRNYIDDTEVEIQRRRMAGWELSFNYRQFIGAAAVDGSLAYRRGTGALRALPAPEEAFGEGTSRLRLVNADLQLAWPLQLGGQRLRYLGSWRGQWNDTPLVPQDRFAIGGRYTVRGFDGELALVGERGWLIRNDLGLALGNSGQEIYLGLDYGRVGSPTSRWQAGKHLAGGVVGWRGGYRGWFWDAFVGRPINKPRTFVTNDATAGFHLSWSY